MINDKWSDLQLYLEIRHPDVRNGEPIYVVRAFEIDDLQQAAPGSWKVKLEAINRVAPVLALVHVRWAIFRQERVSRGSSLHEGRPSN